MIKKNTLIKDFKEGMTIKGFYLCSYIESKITRLGDEYLDVQLEDKTGSIRAKIWSFVDSYKDLINSSSAVAVKGKIIKYNNLNEVNILYINNVEPSIYSKYGYNESNLVRKVDEKVSVLFNYIIKKINDLDEPYLSILKLIVKENENKIKRIPSLDSSYNLSGGYLLEIVTILKLNENIFSSYKKLDKNIVISGIILKNIGLINFFNDDIQFSIKDGNENLDLRILSLNLINHYFNKDKYKIINKNVQNIIISNNDSSEKNTKFINALYDFNKNMKKSKI